MEPETNVGGEGAPAQPSSETSTTALTVEAIREALLPDIAHQVNTATANLFRGMQGVLDGTVKQIADTLGVDRETALAMKEAAKAQLGDEAYGEITRRATQETEAARTRRELEELKARPTQVPEQERLNQEWSSIHLPELQEYAQDLGIDFAEAYRQMAKKSVFQYSDRFLGWKRDFRKVANAMADEKRRDEEGKKTVLDQTRGAAVTAKDYSTASIRDIPDEEFTKNFREIAAAAVAKNRR